jgi:hypothetical protein
VTGALDEPVAPGVDADLAHNQGPSSGLGPVHTVSACGRMQDEKVFFEAEPRRHGPDAGCGRSPTSVDTATLGSMTFKGTSRSRCSTSWIQRTSHSHQQ